MEAVAQLDEDFPRVEEVRSAKGKAVVEQNAAVGDIDGTHGDGETLAEIFAQRQVKGCVAL
jgi:hypothetical protein